RDFHVTGVQTCALPILENLDVEAGAEDEARDAPADGKDDAPVVKFVNKVLIDAIKRGASDIHFEPYETDYRVRLRVDGILKQSADRKSVVEGRRVDHRG